MELQANATLTYQRRSRTTSRSDQGYIQLSFERYRGRRWIVGASGRFETNESLGLVLRSQAGARVGYRIVNSNSAQVDVRRRAGRQQRAGCRHAADAEHRGADRLQDRSTTEYSHPKTNFDLAVQYYPSLSNWGRAATAGQHRGEARAVARFLYSSQRLRHLRQRAAQPQLLPQRRRHRHLHQLDVRTVNGDGTGGWEYSAGL